MMNKRLILTSMILAVTLILGMAGCGDAGGEANTKAPVRLFIAELNEGQPFFMKVWDWNEDRTEFTIPEDAITCMIQNKPISPGMEDSETSYYMDVICKGYEVSYFRKDVGTRVPATFTGSINSVCEINGEVVFPIVICRASQKDMPPLIDLCEFGYDLETGLPEIHMSVNVVVWGETFAGEEVVTDPGRLTVNVACDWDSED